MACGLFEAQAPREEDTPSSSCRRRRGQIVPSGEDKNGITNNPSFSHRTDGGSSRGGVGVGVGRTRPTTFLPRERSYAPKPPRFLHSPRMLHRPSNSMAAMLFRGLKGVNISCVSAASFDRRPALQRRSIDNLCSNSAFSHPHLLSPATSSRHLLREELDFLFDADIVPVLPVPSTSSSSSVLPIDHDDRLKTESEERVDHLRSATAGGGSSWVRFHTVDGGESPALCRLPRKDPRGVGAALADGEMGMTPPPSSSVELIRSGVGRESRNALLRSASSLTRDQVVVVLRVSLHCKACEGKVRKHLSRMPGVTSFSIDFASKKVIVEGEVTPLEVLSSVSKVKKAQLWPSPPTPSSLI